ncbi:phosphatase 2C-like domain-containing protein [Russula earlei]|uniref:Phosphatase 2C-like domain-containing protein n=1 Tax=Russula earlei TaxID=71964 RepID=A0ACC0UKZ2_9AGAM|nr:phosphatase 2C-like domain-containing protein [Russula earlei]
MYSAKSSHLAEKGHPGSPFLPYPASSPGPRHHTRPPNYPHELPSPSKRARLSSTSSSSSSLPSTPSRDRSTVDFYQARLESAMRLRDTWSHLAQRYAKPLDEDDIIDLREVKILKDRGVVRNLHTQVNFGDISIPDELGNDASSEAGGAHSEFEDDIDEIDTLSPGARVQNGLEAQLRRIKPLRDLDSEDEDDLRDFLETERRTREEFGPIDEDFTEDLAQLQDDGDVEDESGDLADEVIEISGSSDGEECEDEDLSRTFTRNAPPEDDDSDPDELGGWVHDESNAIYEVIRSPASSDYEVIEIFDTPPSSPPPSSPPPSSPLTSSPSPGSESLPVSRYNGLARCRPFTYAEPVRITRIYPVSNAATEKHTETGKNARFAYGISEMQGWRLTMEDSHAISLNLDELEEDELSNTFFAVYDGHGGGSVARFAGQNVHRRLIQEDSYQQQNYEEAMRRAFLGTDEDMLADRAYIRDPSGCTAVTALVTNDNKIFVANAGDSRVVLSVKGEAKPLSFDHKPANESERKRILAAGGYIEFGRVNGNLALARALGDFEFKKNYSLTPDKQIITSDPDITVHDMTYDDEFLVLACDGIWDCLNSQHVVDFVRREVAQDKPLGQICENIMEHCLAPDTHGAQGIGCDNMTILIVAILNGKTEEEWYAMIRDRLSTKYGYDTPDAPPQIYSAARLMSWRTRRANVEALEREEAQHQARERNVPYRGTHPSSLEQLRRVINDTLGNGISFHPGSAIMSDSGTIMFGDDSESDEDKGDEPNGANTNSILAGALSHDVGEHEPAEDFDEPMDADEEDFREPFDRVIDLSQAERDRAEIRANGLHGHEHDSPTPSSTSTQEPSSPPPDTPRGETPPLPRQIASGLAKQKQLSTLPDAVPTTIVEYRPEANGEPSTG